MKNGPFGLLSKRAGLMVRRCRIVPHRCRRIGQIETASSAARVTATYGDRSAGQLWSARPPMTAGRPDRIQLAVLLVQWHGMKPASASSDDFIWRGRPAAERERYSVGSGCAADGNGGILQEAFDGRAARVSRAACRRSPAPAQKHINFQTIS